MNYVAATRKIKVWISLPIRVAGTRRCKYLSLLYYFPLDAGENRPVKRKNIARLNDLTSALD